MKKILVGIVVVVLSLASVGAVVMADYWWAGNEMDLGRGGGGLSLPNWMDVADTGPAGTGVM